jgi:hypothetical protein
MFTRLSMSMCVIAVGCNGPKPGVVIVRDGDHYVVSVLECGDPKWLGLPVSEINVGKMPPGVLVAAQCKLRVSSGTPDVERGLTQWRYGSQPKGYVLEHCAALEPGVTYEIYVSEAQNLALGHFTVANNGEVTMIDGQCHK